jgi:hypothetical protein
MERMSDRLLDIGENLIVAFPVKEYDVPISETKTISAQTSLCYVFRVSAWYPFYYEWDKLGALSKGGYSGLNYLGETGHGSGDDILRIERDDFQVYHVFLAPDDPNVRIYRSISPVGSVLSALDRKVSSDLASVSSGSKFDCYTGKQVVDKFNPTSIAENLVFRAGSSDSGKSFQWGFYAIESIPSTYTFYLIGRSYKLIPVTDETMRKKIIIESMLPADKQERRTISITIGGLAKPNFSLSKFVPDDWDIVDNTIIYTPDI